MLSIVLLIVLQSVTVFAMTKEQTSLYKQGILYYDIDACSTSGSTGGNALSPGQGTPNGLQFPNLDPAAMATAIDKYIQEVNADSKMKGLGSTIVASSKNSNINPFFIVSIAQKESQLSSPSDYNVRNGNNSFGRTATSSQPHFVGARTWYKWSSVKASVDHTAQENINAAGGGDAAAYLKEQYKEQVEANDLVELMMIYAPPHENNTEEYIRNIRSWMDRMVDLTNSSGGGTGRQQSPSENSRTKVEFSTGMTVNTDGIGPSHGNPYHQSQTSYANGRLNADETNYIALAQGYARNNNLTLGDVAVVQYRGKTAYAIYADNWQNVDEIHGEGSYRLVTELGMSFNGTSGGADSGVHYIVYPGTANLLNGSIEQNKINEVGQQLFGESPSGNTESQQEGNCVCAPGSSGQTQLKGADAEAKIFNFYASKGYTPEQAAAFVGNYYQESGYDPALVNSIGATGIAQWLGGRLTALQNFASEKGKPHTDFQIQLEFSIYELDGSEGAAKSSIKGVTGTGREAVEQATIIIRTQYERPGEHEANDARRIAKALEVYGKLGDGSGGTVSGTATPGGGCGSGTQGSGVSNGSFMWPLETTYPVTSCYGYARGRLHTGIDIGAPRGTSIKASDGGTVELARDYDPGGFGKAVIIKHGNGFWTLYAHLHTLSVGQGQKVDQGQVIGTVNNTGSSFGDHLHFNIQKSGGEGQSSVNPLEHLPKDPGRGVSGGDCPSTLG